LLGQRREADEIGEQHRHQAPLGGRLAFLRASFLRPLCKGSPALAAELLGPLERGPARGADERERGAALGAELPPGGVVRSAVSADHQAITSTGAAARSSQGVAWRRSKISRASVSPGSSPSSSSATARQNGTPRSPNASAAALKPDGSPSSRARKR